VSRKHDDKKIAENIAMDTDLGALTVFGLVKRTRRLNGRCTISSLHVLVVADNEDAAMSLAFLHGGFKFFQ
jgi:hypothetical protein